MSLHRPELKAKVLYIDETAVKPREFEGQAGAEPDEYHQKRIKISEDYRKVQNNLEAHRTQLRGNFQNEFVPKEYYTEQLSDSKAGGRSSNENMKFFSISTIIELIQLLIILASSIPLNLLNWAAHVIFNEMTVGSACYQIALYLLPLALTNFPVFPLKVDYAILYSKELQFPQTQVTAGFKMMIWFPIACMIFSLLCFLDLYEVNDLTLMIPALQFKSEGIMYTLRFIYLAVVFIQLVITLPILEQRFFFIFMSNLIAEMGFIRKLESLGEWLKFLGGITRRNGILNQGLIYCYHLFTYNAVIYYNFAENNPQFYGVFFIVAFNLILIHALRARHGIVASITGQILMNSGFFFLLMIIYYSDTLHKGYNAEQHTTLRSNAIDFIFGQNENYAANL